MDYIISRNTKNGLTYAYYRGEFWFWDDNVGRWFLSTYAEEMFAQLKAKQHGTKPEDMMSSGAFEPLDDWDIPTRVIDDLRPRDPKEEKRKKLPMQLAVRLCLRLPNRLRISRPSLLRCL